MTDNKPEKLTALLIAGMDPRPKRFEVYDSEVKGFGVRVTPDGKKTFFYRYYIEGHRKRYSIGPAATVKVHAARDIATIKAGEVAQGLDPSAIKKQRTHDAKTAPAKTLGGFFEKHHREWLLAERKAGRLAANRIKRNFEQWFNKKMADINPFLLEAWRKKRRADGVTAHTITRDLADLKKMLSRAVELGMITDHPLARLRPIKTEDNARVRFLSPDEEKRLFDALSARENKARAARIRYNEWRKERQLEPFPEITEDQYSDRLAPLVILALNTGLRRGELFSLEWADLDFLNNLLTVRAAAAKGGKKRHVPLNETARQTLRKWHTQNAPRTGKPLAGLVFPGKDGKRLDNIASSWRKLTTDAKLHNFTFHDCRHDFATKTLKAGADIVTLSRILGHADLKMTLRYAHVANEDLQAAVDRLAAGADR